MRVIMGIKEFKVYRGKSKIELFKELERLSRINLNIRKSRRDIFKENVTLLEENRSLQNRLDLVSRKLEKVTMKLSKEKDEEND